MILAGKRVLVTGVVNRRSIAYAIAERSQEQGAEVILTSFGRVRRITERAAKGLPETPDILELDANRDQDFAVLARELGERWGRVDGAVHAIAHAPPDALGGNFLGTPRESARIAFETSAFSLSALAGALAPLMGSNGNGTAGAYGAIVGLDFDASVAWPGYDWMGVSKAALEAVCRYLSSTLGPAGVRANLISAGPLATAAATGIDGFSSLSGTWDEWAPLGWDAQDPLPVADAATFLLSDLARGISGEIVHVDGGAHAVGAGALTGTTWA